MTDTAILSSVSFCSVWPLKGGESGDDLKHAVACAAGKVQILADMREKALQDLRGINGAIEYQICEKAKYEAMLRCFLTSHQSRLARN